jgi:hypothetical protein
VGSGGDTRAAKDADMALDRMWGAFHSWLSGWAELKEHPDAPMIAALHSFLFSGGLAFLAFRYEKEWAAVGAALLRPPSPGVDGVFGSEDAGNIVSIVRSFAPGNAHAS